MQSEREHSNPVTYHQTARYLQDTTEGTLFSANQIRFVTNIIDHLTQNGVMDPGLLYESPYTDTHTEGLDGVFNDADADKLIAIIRSFNASADTDFSSSDRAV